MRKTFMISALLLSICLFSCKKDDAPDCLTCRSESTIPFELCKERDGNASVNGENTKTPYNQYLNDLRDEGVVCGN